MRGNVLYGLRHIVEIAISVSKRTFGELVRARTPYTVCVKIVTKIATYNRNPDIKDMVIQDVDSGAGDNPYGSLASMRVLDGRIAACALTQPTQDAGKPAILERACVF